MSRGNITRLGGQNHVSEPSSQIEVMLTLKAMAARHYKAAETWDRRVDTRSKIAKVIGQS